MYLIIALSIFALICFVISVVLSLEDKHVSLTHFVIFLMVISLIMIVILLDNA